MRPTFCFIATQKAAAVNSDKKKKDEVSGAMQLQVTTSSSEEHGLSTAIQRAWVASPKSNILYPSEDVTHKSDSEQWQHDYKWLQNRMFQRKNILRIKFDLMGRLGEEERLVGATWNRHPIYRRVILFRRKFAKASQATQFLHACFHDTHRIKKKKTDSMPALCTL